MGEPLWLHHQWFIHIFLCITGIWVQCLQGLCITHLCTPGLYVCGQLKQTEQLYTQPCIYGLRGINVVNDSIQGRVDPQSMGHIYLLNQWRRKWLSLNHISVVFLGQTYLFNHFSECFNISPATQSTRSTSRA